MSQSLITTPIRLKFALHLKYRATDPFFCFCQAKNGVSISKFLLCGSVAAWLQIKLISTLSMAAWQCGHNERLFCFFLFAYKILIF